MSATVPTADLNPLRSEALRRARQIIDTSPGASLTQLVALAWLTGRIDVCQELKPTLDRSSRELHEYDAICGSCGKRDGSRMAVAADVPEAGYFTTRCFHCSAADDTTRAASTSAPTTRGCR